MTQQKSKVLNVSLWVTQGLLAAAFGMAGIMKITTPIEQLAQNGMGFVNNYSVGMVRFIGIAELLAAIGLILPTALRILPILTPIAASALALIMILAAQYHFTHDESILSNFIFTILAVFIAWGRFKKLPIQQK